LEFQEGKLVSIEASTDEGGDVGEDTLTGGAGNDRFVLAPNGDSPTIDVIGKGYCCGY